MPDHSETLADDLIWGAANIAAFIGRSKRSTCAMLEAEQLPAKKVRGAGWCASRARLRAFFTGVDVGEAHSASPAPEAPQERAPVVKPVRRTSSRIPATVHKLTPRPGRGRAA